MPEDSRSSVELIDKPSEWTSNDVVRYLKKKYKPLKVGHAGTLDPMATGLLIVLIGKETKRFNEFQKMNKEYVAEIKFGYETDTGDRTGQVKIQKEKIKSETVAISTDNIKRVLESMVGEQMQSPPDYSAVKVGGVAAYKLARRGERIETKAKNVNVYEAELVEVNEKESICTVRFVVSSGTYIRNLAEDLGREIGTGATLWELRRTRIGEYKVEDANLVSKFGKNY